MAASQVEQYANRQQHRTLVVWGCGIHRTPRSEVCQGCIDQGDLFGDWCRCLNGSATEARQFERERWEQHDEEQAAGCPVLTNPLTGGVSLTRRGWSSPFAGSAQSRIPRAQCSQESVKDPLRSVLA